MRCHTCIYPYLCIVWKCQAYFSSVICISLSSLISSVKRVFRSSIEMRYIKYSSNRVCSIEYLHLIDVQFDNRIAIGCVWIWRARRLCIKLFLPFYFCHPTLYNSRERLKIKDCQVSCTISSQKMNLKT